VRPAAAVPVPVAVIPLAPVLCPGCQGPLVLTQPDLLTPLRLIGSCHLCLAFYPVSATNRAPSTWTVGDRLDAWPETDPPPVDPGD